MRLVALLSFAVIAIVASLSLAQCPGGRCPLPQQVQQVPQRMPAASAPQYQYASPGGYVYTIIRYDFVNGAYWPVYRIEQR
jgi:hypothetical protein